MAWTRVHLVVLLFGLAGSASAQAPDSTRTPYHMPFSRHDQVGLLVGFVQGRYSAAEIGLSRNIFGSMHHPFSFDYFAGAEIALREKPTVAPKVGIWVSGGVAMGAQAIWYSDGPDHAVVLRPEFGIGIFKAKVTYGYNFRVAGQALPHMNTHVLNVTYCFLLKRLKDEEY